MGIETEEVIKDIDSLRTRVRTLEETVNLEVLPRLNRNTEMTAEIHAKNDEMYSAFVRAKNGVNVIIATGNGMMWFADKVGRLAKPLWVFVIIGGGSILGLKVPEWVVAIGKLFK